MPAFDERRLPAGDPLLHDLLVYWESKLQGRAMPSRRDIDPAEILHLLPHVLLVDVVDGGARFRYRLMGTAVVSAFGSDDTGKFVEPAIPEAQRPGPIEDYVLAARARRPALIVTRYTTARRGPTIAKRLLTPLSKDGTDVTMLAGVYTFAPGGTAPLRPEPGSRLVEIL
jgi:hypothetical protein